MALTFRMYAGIRFNREIDSEKDYISPGGYEFVMDGKQINFDFCEYSGTINKVDKCLLEVELRNPDYDEFPDLKTITSDMLRKTTEISEFFVFTGEESETDLTPVALDYVSFVLPYENFKQINVDKNVLRNAKMESNIN